MSPGPRGVMKCPTGYTVEAHLSSLCNCVSRGLAGTASPRPEYHQCEGRTELRIASVRRAPAGVPTEDIVEALGVDPSEAYLLMVAARLLGTPPHRKT